MADKTKNKGIYEIFEKRLSNSIVGNLILLVFDLWIYNKENWKNGRKFIKGIFALVIVVGIYLLFYYKW